MTFVLVWFFLLDPFWARLRQGRSWGCEKPERVNVLETIVFAVCCCSAFLYTAQLLYGYCAVHWLGLRFI
jgi:hypothetical protein